MKKTKLEMVPAGKGAIAASAAETAGLVVTNLPKNLKRLSAPPLLKIENIPVGATVSGEILALAPSISSRKDMQNSKLIHMRHEKGTEFLVPLTGVIKKAVGGDEGITSRIGKSLFLTRQPDGETTKYGGKKKMFMVDVFVAE